MRVRKEGYGHYVFIPKNEKEQNYLERIYQREMIRRNIKNNGGNVFLTILLHLGFHSICRDLLA